MDGCNEKLEGQAMVFSDSGTEVGTFRLSLEFCAFHQTGPINYNMRLSGG